MDRYYGEDLIGIRSNNKKRSLSVSKGFRVFIAAIFGAGVLTYVSYMFVSFVNII